MEEEFEVYCNIADEILKLRFDKIVEQLSQMNIHLKNISDSLELISNN